MHIDQRIEGVWPTKKGAGVLVKGVNGSSESDVFDVLCRKLYDFYESKKIDGNEDGVIMPTVPFDRGAGEYRLPVYFAEVGPVNYGYFNRDTGEHLGFNLDLEELAGLANSGHDVDRQEVSSKPARKYGNVWIKRLPHDTGRECKSLALGVFEWDKPVFLVYFRAYNRDKQSAEEQSVADRDAFAEMAAA